MTPSSKARFATATFLTRATARGSWLSLSLLASLLVLLHVAPAAAQDCRWDGTAPFCSGECRLNETEVTRLDAIPDFWIPPFVVMNPPFGENCATGTKALCCTTPGVTCRWDGTAPFCDGECRDNERPSTPPAGSSSGAACWTGSKAYCCRSTGSVGSRLEVASELTRYAALWSREKGPVWQARHGLSASEYQQVFDNLAKKGYRPVEIDGYSVGGEARYAAIWEQKEGPTWVARHGLSARQHQREVSRLTRDGYRPVDLSGYVVGGVDLYASIWEQRQGPAWVARHGLSAQQYQAEFERLAGEGFRIVDVSGYAVGGQDRYAAFWEKDEGPPLEARHGLTSAQYQQHFNELAQRGFRVTRLSAWFSGGEPRFAAIWTKVDGAAWAARHGMLSDVYQEEFFKFASEGYRLERISGYQSVE